ncbi:MAG: globin [Alphaproteobacteria bacterium PA2]|nr:MAG: globin [Alphaproteobacteria bacterium PA2]
MPDQREQLIIETFEIAADLCEDLTPLVYARLFRDQPEMEPLFWRDKNHQVKGEMLSRVISAILDFAGERHYASTMIQCEVITHEGYDVPPEVFATFFGTVRNTLAELLAGQWTPAKDEAWASLLIELNFYVTHPDQSQTIPA